MRLAIEFLGVRTESILGVSGRKLREFVLPQVVTKGLTQSTAIVREGDFTGRIVNWNRRGQASSDSQQSQADDQVSFHHQGLVSVPHH